ncbi:MAG TPA: hypothetical protein VG389_19670 [Myxococcota bacterium]|jgi:sugar lactone lactonase YvrE|nr:hypothetical protein [Myxococcota bacterium]
MRWCAAMALAGMLVWSGGLGACTRERCDAPGTVCTVVGTGNAELDSREGAPALEAPLYQPMDLAFGPDGNAYVIDFNNHRVRRWDLAAGTVESVAGSGFAGDGPPGPATATALNHPTDVTFDGDGYMVIAAWHNSKVKRVDLAAGTIEDAVGNGLRGFCGDGGPAEMACLDLASSVAYDAAGNLYVSDQGNNRIRRVDPSGLISTFAGTGAGTGLDPVTFEPLPECIGGSVVGTLDCWTGDGGPAAAATLNNPRGESTYPCGRLAINPSDATMFIADTGNHVVRRIDLASGVITTFAGTGGAEGYGGDGGPATSALMSYPTDVAVDPEDGTLFVADMHNSCVRSVTPDGVIHTAAGICAAAGPGYDPAPERATAARFYHPYGVNVGPDGTLYVADTDNNVVRAVRRF